MRAVNLLPRETRSSRSGSRVDPLVAGGAALTAVVVAAVGGGFFVVHSHAAAAQKKLATARAELAVLQAAAKHASGGTTQILPTPAVTQEQGPWTSALASALQSRVPWDGVLSQLGRVVPANVTLSTVTLGSAGGATGSSSTSSSSSSSSSTATTTGAPATLELGGTAFSEEGVAQLLSRLALVPNLGDVALTSSTADPKTGRVTFEISAQVSISTTAPAAPAAGGTSS